VASLCVGAVVVVGAIGCGGGDSTGDEGDTTSAAGVTNAAPTGSAGSESTESTTKTSSSKSKSAYLKQANEICAQNKKGVIADVRKYLKEHKSESGESDSSDGSKLGLLREAVQATLLPSIENQITELRALDVPEDDQKQVEAFLTAQQKAVKRASASEDSTVLIGKFFHHAAGLARDYGLTDCAYG
jgi:hypothetical protein